MHRTSFVLVALALSLGTAGCCSSWHHGYYEAQKEAFANQVAEKCAEAVPAQPQQIIILPAGSDPSLVPPPVPAPR
jgi:hypothetical protein